MLLLDTNGLSETLRPSPEPRVVAWLDHGSGTAAAYDLTLATRNVKDFEGLSLRLVDPWADSDG